MIFSDATIDDATLISEFVTAISLRHISPSLTDVGTTKLLASMDTKSTVERINAGWLHLCCMDSGELCGVLVIKPPLHLYHLFVRSDRQRTGIGKSLFKVADLRVIKETGSPITTVNSSLNAVEAYQHLAFVIDGPVQDHEGVRFQPMIRNTG